LIPLKRRGLPEEVAKAALYLASDDSAYCLARELMLDGGLSQLAYQP
jgi:NAD(P)-dependent dehydrogenase (short-subunit alcohol dehydrogenase family)